MGSASDPRASTAPPGRARQPGDLLDGRYRLVARLGHGGFGDVWRADELLPDGAPFRQVALKLLVPGGGDAVDWAEEAKLLASFRHPSLVTVYAAGILEGSERFVAMELLEGQNLSELHRARGPLPWRRVLGWAASAAAALDLIHAAGVVHLDLKPANLFVTDGGALKVLDFGIARRAGVAAVVARRGARLEPDATVRDVERATGLFFVDRTEVAPSGRLVSDEPSHGEEAFAATRPVSSSARQVVIGTPGFMAPEVMELAEPTAAADAYALAVCVVQLCTGHLPHLAPPEPEVWDDPTAVSAWLDAVRAATLRGSWRDFELGPVPFPRALSALVRRLLSVDPARRGVPAGQLGAQFEEVWARPYGVADPPYFSLDPYPAEGEGILFGRDDDIARLGRELEYEPCVVLHGARGSGKSSLLAAGLVPYLGRRAVDGKDDWVAVTVPLGGVAAPDAALAAALARLDDDLAGADVEALAAFARASSRGVALVLDPLEEPLGGGRLAALVAAIAGGPVIPGLRLLGALGEDRTAAFLSSPEGAALRSALRYVSGPATSAVIDLVSGPAHFAGITVLGAEVVAADVRGELRRSPGRLPFVSLALAEWWRTRGPARVTAPGNSSPPSAGPALRGEVWKETGGVGGAVVRHAERVVSTLEPEARAVAQEILLRLSATDGSLVRWDEDELAAVVAPPTGEESARAVLATLARALLVRLDGGRVEIGHEALLREWQGLTSARLAQMDRLLLLERLRDARLAWERADNHKDFLAHGALLDDARAHEPWLARGLGPQDRTFLAASRRRARLRGAWRWALGGFVALSLGGGVSAQHMIDEARAQEAKARAAAVELAQLDELAAKARRTEDPYVRATLAAAAIVRGSTDGMLPLDLAAATANLAHAEILTLDRIDAPSFPWDDRYLLGTSSAGTIEVFDFRPPEPDVIEDIDLDFDPAEPDAAHYKRPARRRLRPHQGPVVERADFAFDTSFATRSSSGEVKVFRLRDDGLPALAAVAPFRCMGPMKLAAAAPVLACGTDHGVARWDLRRRDGAAAVAHHAFQGDVSDLSADGERVAAVSDRQVLFWSPGTGAEARYTAPSPVSVVRLSPEPHLAALLEGAQVEIVHDRLDGAPGARRTAEVLFTLMPDEGNRATRLFWDEGGLDLAVCEPNAGRWYYLRRGGRAKDDPPPKGDACAPPRPRGQPELVTAPEDAPELADRDVGAHLPTGGWKLRGHRYLTRDLVVLDATAGRAPVAARTDLPPAAARLLRFEGRDQLGREEPVEKGDSLSAVARDETTVMFQVGEEMRFHAIPDGAHLVTRKGNFLRRCADGRWLAWEVDGASYRIFDAFLGATLRTMPREPGLIVGAGAACRAVYTQRLDGTLVLHPLDGRPSRPLAQADGYVYDARPSGGASPGDTGLLLALSSGAIVRVDDASRSVRVLGYATPRADALADGHRPGEVLFADATGVVLLRPSSPPEIVRAGDGLVEWTDLSLSPNGVTLLATAADRVAAIDVARRELLGSIPTSGKERMTRWDDEGSVLLWSFDRMGGAEGTVIPRGAALAKRVSMAVSNLDAEKGRIVLRP